MGWQNPPLPWSELERRLAGRPPPADQPPRVDGGDAPAWSSRRQPCRSPADQSPGERGPGRVVVPYAELHCHSNASFLDGGSHPEELAEEAARLRLEALAITDHDGLYGIVRFAEAARTLGLPTIFGAELTLPGASEARRGRWAGGTGRTGTPDPVGEHLVVLARGAEGYGRLCRAISEAQMAGAKGAPRGDLGRLAELHGGLWVVLTGCRKGPVPRALVERGPAAAQVELDRLVQAFGRDNVYVEIWDHGDPLDSARNDALVRLADRARVEVVATNNVHYATPGRRRLATALAAVRARSSLAELDGWLPAGAGAHLRSGFEQAARMARYPGTVELAAE
ncbi:MAG TPA: PHP domain-containing protein, partial [Actinomycetes bacterium]|nr:PHP domain-containing protein [Actinomycetes bacterium]